MGNIEILIPTNIKSDNTGYLILAQLFNKLKEYEFETIDMDFKNTRFIEANLTAVLGAIFDKISELNIIYLHNIKNNIKNIFQKNDFLSNYGFLKVEDTYHTTIRYKKFQNMETQLFSDYIFDELFTKNLPPMSSVFKRAVARSFLEIFVNAGMHGESKSVYACGQYFPNKGNKLNFTIVDTGKTIRENVNNFYLDEYVLTGAKAIEWAVKANTTTKINATGGLGLNIAREFIKKNRGKIQIISDNGFWQEDFHGTISEEFADVFPGTIVNFEINMNDSQSYRSEEEQENREIFN